MCVGPEALIGLGIGAKTAATLAPIASVAMGGLTALSAVGSIQQGRAQGKMAEYNAQVAQNEAIAAQQRAQYDEDIHRRDVARVKGAQRAGAAASGGELLDMGDVFGETAAQAEMDALAIRYGGKLASNAALQRAEIARAEGKAARSAGIAKAGSTLLTAGMGALGSGAFGASRPGFVPGGGFNTGVGGAYVRPALPTGMYGR